ncbi:MAG: hypothetical protein JRN43_01345 [Nitrososphaerota archaeon]|nr:hypothetical protein [Nitrososphaerota archaeon]MDG7018938.1 hypothetical protein [Nitrososphaerota archaeon]
MPELWIPYGTVETLVTIQAENLGAVSGAPAGAPALDIERLVELAKGSTSVFVCDAAPATLEVLKGIVAPLGETPRVFYSPAPKGIEASIPELKGRVATLPPPLPVEGDDVSVAPELKAAGAKLFIGTARPDPFFGLLDAKVEACLDWVARARAKAAEGGKAMEPAPFRKGTPYEAIEGMAEKITEPKFVTVVPRGGKAHATLEDPPFDAIKNAFARTQMPQAKGLVVGAGGRGYDDTLSSSVRGLWNVVDAVRKTGTILLIAQCSEGVGSTALEMMVTGRLSDEKRRREAYVDGLEEVFYLNKLKDEYDVLLLSGLPETYARAKLGLATAKGSGEAVGRLLNKVGRSGKVNVVPRAPECLVESA